MNRACAFALIALAALPCGNLLADEPAAKKIGLAPGEQLPFFVVDFLNGKHQGNGGCPGVMVANAQARGVFILATVLDQNLLDLLAALEASGVDGDKVHGHLVIAAAEDKVPADLLAKVKTFNVGIPRSLGQEVLKGLGLDGEKPGIVVLSDRKDVNSRFELAGKLSPETQSKIVTAVKELASAK